MANKKFLLGILVLALVFGMMVVGCDLYEEEPSAMLRIRNESTFNIRYITFQETNGSTISADPVNIRPGGSKTYEFSKERYVYVTILVNAGDEDLELKSYEIYALSDKDFINTVILRGTTKETLVLSVTGENK